MKTNYKPKAANQDEITLYCLIGEAVCYLQNLEGALSILITLKMNVKYPNRMSKQEADVFLKKNYRLTLGDAIEKAKKNSLYSDALFNDLDLLKEERNWLVHRLLQQNVDDIKEVSKREKLFQRIKAISNEANRFQLALETDLIEFSRSVNVDMSGVLAEIKQYYEGSPS